MTDVVSIVYEATPDGGRLKYFGQSATVRYWEGLWDQLVTSTDYTRAEHGHLPHQLRSTFLRWAPPGGRVLEAGCGLGHFTVAATARGFQADGVDFAPGCIGRLQRRFPNITFFAGDVCHLDAVPDDTYDVVYSPGVVEHFEKGPAAVLGETHRILKSGGFAVVSCPYMNPVRCLLGRMGAFSKPAHGAFFQYAFGRRELTRILQDIGFDVVQFHSYGTLKTLQEHVPLLGRMPLGPLGTPIGFLLDSLPATRAWGHSAIWVARKRGRSPELRS